MRFTRKYVGGALAALLLTSGCTTQGAADSQQVKVSPPLTITVEGTRAVEYQSLDELAAKSSSIAKVQATGRQVEVPLPDEYGLEDSAPTIFVAVKVLDVLAGETLPKEILVVSPGLVDGSSKQALLDAGPYVLFLAPAMYEANAPAGGYAVVGGPAGTFVSGDDVSEELNGTYFLTDTESPKLPATIEINELARTSATKTEKELLSEGP